VQLYVQAKPVEYPSIWDELKKGRGKRSRSRRRHNQESYRSLQAIAWRCSSARLAKARSATGGKFFQEHARTFCRAAVGPRQPATRRGGRGGGEKRHDRNRHKSRKGGHAIRGTILFKSTVLRAKDMTVREGTMG